MQLSDEKMKRVRLLFRISTVTLWLLVGGVVFYVFSQNQDSPNVSASDETQPIQKALKPIVVTPKDQSDVSANGWDPKGIQDFEFTERSGKKVTKQDLLGKPWVVCFVFTRCAGPCPRVTGQMKMLQDQLARAGKSDVRLVTMTVDPKYDTAEVLTRYADAFDADKDRWLFLTGDQNEIYGLIRDSFKMPVKEIVGEDRIPGFEVLHTMNVLHINAEGVVVGKYNSLLDTDMVALRRALIDKPKKPEQAELPLATETVEPFVPGWVISLPGINAGLNSLATVLLMVGFVLIKQGKRDAHKCVMLTAFGASVLFLTCYLVYHGALQHYTGSGSRSFTGTGTVRTVYLSILVSHVILAVPSAGLALVTIYRGLKGQWAQHKKIAKITFPIWLYVSVTGVIIYWMLYHMSMG